MIRLSILFVIVPLVASAQEAAVRTAEHQGFTRVAIDYSAFPDWTLAREDTSLVLSTDRAIAYDLSDVFRRIDRDRVADFAQNSANSLTIDLECDCRFETFRFPNGGLAIDIFDGPASTDPTLEEPEPEFAESRIEPRFEAPAGPIAPPVSLLPGLLTRNVSAPPRSEDHEDRVAALRSRLQGDLLAASGGVLESRQEEGAEPGAQYRAEETETRDGRGYSSVPPQIVCPPFAEDELQDWMTARRNVPSTESDLTWMTAEAQRMIAAGMGIEAARLLEAYPDPGSDRQILTELAYLMDDSIEAPAVAQAAECGPLMSLMALIADPPVLPNRVATIVSALQGAPEPVRPFLERRAMSSLLALGREEEATILRNATRSAGDDPQPDLASIAMEDAPPSSDELQAIVSRRTPEAAEAIRVMIENILDAGDSVPVSVLDQARALLPEITGLEKDRIVRAVILAEIAGARFEKASDEIRDVATHTPALAVDLNRHLFESVLGLGDATFLRQMMRLSDHPIADAELRLEIASRATRLHVPDLAISVLDRGIGLPLRGEKLLRAQIAISKDEPERSETLLAGIEGEDAEELRQQATALIASRIPEPPPPAPVLSDTVTARSSRLVEDTAALREQLSQILSE
ncbi:hypothetical protein [Palleronia abyssalis]|uniref:HEAT repeat domain-containing protein n=1 Tax=Palleronia abyssalis TaxID=1501240 RepID=A0A2R8BWW5_9RHOB|nr:hypothetical protein [Palleronia abyssalis]SPJ24649.1 hypothetical protein PAA8504_02486 [Palleronia abyssalis]